ncbi:hypothetical protein Tco_1197301, partial [Tanacetum coccineum]
VTNHLTHDGLLRWRVAQRGGVVCSQPELVTGGLLRWRVAQERRVVTKQRFAYQRFEQYARDIMCPGSDYRLHCLIEQTLNLAQHVYYWWNGGAVQQGQYVLESLTTFGEKGKNFDGRFRVTNILIPMGTSVGNLSSAVSPVCTSHPSADPLILNRTFPSANFQMNSGSSSQQIT